MLEVQPGNMSTKSSVGAGLLLTSNLVTKALGLDNSDVIDDALVEVEVLRQPALG